MTPPPNDPVTSSATPDRLESRFATPLLARWLYALESLQLRWLGYRGMRIPTAVGATLFAHVAKGRNPRGMTILVQHGIGSRGGEFRTMARGLRRLASRVVILDLPGHGFSEGFATAHEPHALFEVWADAVDQALGTAPAVLIGNSLGGGMALRYALRSPRRLSALVLLSPAGAMMEAERLREVLHQFDLQSNEEAGAFLAKLYVHPPWVLRLGLVRRVVRQVFARPFLRELVARLSPADLFTPDMLAPLAVPTLMLWGERDAILPAEGFDYFRAHLPPHLLTAEKVEGVGHCIQHDDPAGFVARLEAFLTSLSNR